MSCGLVIVDLLMVLVGQLVIGTPLRVEESFPRPLSSYHDEHLTGFFQVLSNRIAIEPLNFFATAIFLVAIVHTFLAPMFSALGQRLEEQAHLQRLSRASDDTSGGAASFWAILFHYLGEIEAVFGIWAIPLMLSVAYMRGWADAEHFLEKTVHFDEAVFVVVVMAIASTQPVIFLAERILAFIAARFGSSPTAWWCVILIVGPILGSVITEPAAMTISAIMLAQHFFRYHPSTALSYTTVAILFCNISVGGVLTNFAAPPVIMVASTWGWNTPFMFLTFGWKAICSVVASTLAYRWLFRRELSELSSRVMAAESSLGREYRQSMPVFVVVGNLLFLVWTVTHGYSPRLVIIGFLFFLAFVDATRGFQRSVSLRAPLLVGFFLAGLVIHGEFQAWWLEPLISRLGEPTLFVSSVALSAFNDNASITYLASLVPSFSDNLKYLVVAGALAGGGLTIIANAPNPAGNALLSRFFEGGISPLRLLIAAILPLMMSVIVFVGLR